MKNLEKENRDKLIRLITENPDLPVIPMVDTEIGGDDYGYGVGTFGIACIDEYIIASESVQFKSDDDVFNTLEKYLPTEQYYALPTSELECRLIYNSLPWIKAIIVYINLPENWEDEN